MVHTRTHTLPYNTFSGLLSEVLCSFRDILEDPVDEAMTKGLQIKQTWNIKKRRFSHILSFSLTMCASTQLYSELSTLLIKVENRGCPDIQYIR